MQRVWYPWHVKGYLTPNELENMLNRIKALCSVGSVMLATWVGGNSNTRASLGNTGMHRFFTDDPKKVLDENGWAINNSSIETLAALSQAYQRSSNIVSMGVGYYFTLSTVPK